MAETQVPKLENTVVAERYRVERLIGEGGMGTVWAGRHLSLGQLVAIKFVHTRLLTSAEALRRFDIEARAAARIKSRHTVSVYDHGITPRGEPYIVMEYLEGEPLERRIEREGRLRFEEVVHVISEAGRALEVAHAAGVVHRDLKPDNIFLARDPEAGARGYIVKLVDFGIAKIVEDEAAHGAGATQAGAVLGTPHYMSPEALTGSARVTPASDIWSLGACAFAAACGRVPFDGDAIGDVVLKVCAAPLPRPSRHYADLPLAFDTWFEKACSRHPERRFPSVRDMVSALSDLERWSKSTLATHGYEMRRATIPDLGSAPPELVRPRGARLLAVALALAAVVLGVLGFYAMQRARATRALLIAPAPGPADGQDGRASSTKDASAPGSASRDDVSRSDRGGAE
jgi:serine/threonine-protein kinase